MSYQTPVASPPPQGYPPQSYPPPAGYPTQGYPPPGYPQQGYAQAPPQPQTVVYAQQPATQQRSGASTGCLEGCCAGLACCCCLEMCFN